MNVRIVSREVAGRITLYSGVESVSARDGLLFIRPTELTAKHQVWLSLNMTRDVAEILLDDEGGIE